MNIKEYYTCNDIEKETYLSQINQSDWGAGKYLYELLKSGNLRKLCGEETKVLLLTDEDKLLSFCTFAEKDDIPNTTLSPWIGFAYTFPKYRGKRIIGELFEYAEMLARNNGNKHIYISTNETGLYEKYGYKFYEIMKDIENEDSRVYVKEIK